jgi:hypothetical protein
MLGTDLSASVLQKLPLPPAAVKVVKIVAKEGAHANHISLQYPGAACPLFVWLHTPKTESQPNSSNYVQASQHNPSTEASFPQSGHVQACTVASKGCDVQRRPRCCRCPNLFSAVCRGPRQWLATMPNAPGRSLLFNPPHTAISAVTRRQAKLTRSPHRRRTSWRGPSLSPTG